MKMDVGVMKRSAESTGDWAKKKGGYSRCSVAKLVINLGIVFEGAQGEYKICCELFSSLDEVAVSSQGLS